jgi:hypothetical protein
LWRPPCSQVCCNTSAGTGGIATITFSHVSYFRVGRMPTAMSNCTKVYLKPGGALINVTGTYDTALRGVAFTWSDLGARCMAYARVGWASVAGPSGSQPGRHSARQLGSASRAAGYCLPPPCSSPA